MAIMLDRTTTAASERSETLGRGAVASVSGMGVMVGRVVLERLRAGPPRSPAGAAPVAAHAARARRRPRAVAGPRGGGRLPVTLFLGLAQFPARAQWPFIKPIDGPT